MNLPEIQITGKGTGVFLSKRKFHNTKKIRIHGKRIVTYMYQPHSLNFKNHMINDINQDYCGGWTMPGVDYSNQAYCERVFYAIKPISFIVVEKEEEKKIQNAFKSFHKSPHFSGKNSYLVAQEGYIKSMFDLSSLRDDYMRAFNYYKGFHPMIEEALARLATRRLSDYFEDWDAQEKGSKITLIETGLILGYSIENTISILKNGVR